MNLSPNGNGTHAPEATQGAGRHFAPSRIRVAILDPNDLLREGLTALFNNDDAFACVGSWGDADSALDALPDARPDILLVDIRLPERAGFEVLREISAAYPDIRVIVTVECREESCVVLHPQGTRAQAKGAPALSHAFSAPDDCLQIALKMGAQGVLRKQCSFRYIAQAVRTVYTGQYWMELPTATRLAQQYLISVQPAASADATGERSLTLRERQVITLIAQGRSNKEIAREMQLAYSTVKNYVSSILEKLELSDRTQIALYAIDQSSADPEPVS